MTTWLDEPNTTVTTETLTANAPFFAADPIAWYAMRAILQEVQKIRLPKYYLIDMAQDFTLLHKYPAERFVYCIRESGTHIFLPQCACCTNPAESLRATHNVCGTECHWYTYDMNDIRQRDDYNEPHLRACTAEEAMTFLVDKVITR